MNTFSRGYHDQRYCLWVRTRHNDEDEVGQHGSHTPANVLTKTCSLGLERTSSILDIYVMVNRHLSKKKRYKLTSIT